MSKEGVIRQLKTVAPSVSPGEQAFKAFESDIEDVKKFLEGGTAPGFAIVCYDRSKYEGGTPKVRTWSHYFCYDPFDVHLLPDFAKNEIIRLRDKDD